MPQHVVVLAGFGQAREVPLARLFDDHLVEWRMADFVGLTDKQSE